MKYLDLYSRILNKIETRQLKSGDRLPDTMDLAKEFRVSHGTVAKALGLLREEGYVRRVKSKGSYISAAVRKSYFETNQANRIGWLFRGDYATLLNTVYLAESFSEAGAALAKEGKLLIPIPLVGKSADDYLHEIQSSFLAAAIVNDLHLPALHDGLRKLKIPYVCTDILDFKLPVHQVTYDHLKAGALALSSLYSRGSRNLLYFGNYHAKSNRNDSDHETIWRSFEQSAGAERLRKVKSCFLAWTDRAQLKREIRKTLLENPKTTGVCCGVVTFYRIIKELLEKDADFSDRVLDMVVLSAEKALPAVRKRPVEIVTWSSAEMGATGARLILSILKGNLQSPRIHYLPVDILRPA